MSSRFSSSVVRCLMLVVIVGSDRLRGEELSPNLVTNPSLEARITGDLPTGWGGFFSSPQGAFRTSITDGGRTGKKMIRIDYAPADGEGAFGVVSANRIEIDPKKRYVARGWVKVAGGKRATADVKLHYYDASGMYVDQTRIGFASPGNDEWQLVTVTDHAAELPKAKFIGLAIACTGDARAQYDDLELLAFEKEKLPPDFEATYGITRSPQLTVLGRRIGDWITTSNIKPCAWLPSGKKTSFDEKIRWAIGGQFLEAHRIDKESGIEERSLTTYDGVDSVYRTWFFGSNGNLPRGPTTGRYDPKTETLTFDIDAGDGGKGTARVRFLGADAVETDFVFKDKDEKTVFEAEGTSRRARY